MRSVKMPKTRINRAGEEQDMPLSQECNCHGRRNFKGWMNDRPLGVEVGLENTVHVKAGSGCQELVAIARKIQFGDKFAVFFRIDNHQNA
ncbi:hypothetical protein AnigIFM63604_003693 [Aspergillus niger]|uniref:Uncharacterized protein n=1 Tax=Aspergillus niger TaxID=5061 RepID=A0A9W5ZPU5_ASPNG|nr:hypothetical protein AnigIFM63604_003693 [Aspergillus niger]